MTVYVDDFETIVTAEPVPNTFNDNRWEDWKQRGTEKYRAMDYPAALQAYQQSLRSLVVLNNNKNNGDVVVVVASNDHGITTTTTTDNNNNNITTSSSNNNNNNEIEQQQMILLSNMVACRLRIGGLAQAEAAVANAEQCIAIDPAWAKGHLRLAEAYSVLARADDDNNNNNNNNNNNTSYTERRLRCSKRAIRALETVLDLDPTNRTARDLLSKEIRYSMSNGGEHKTPSASAPPEHMDGKHRNGSGTTDSRTHNSGCRNNSNNNNSSGCGRSRWGPNRNNGWGCHHSGHNGWHTNRWGHNYNGCWGHTNNSNNHHWGHGNYRWGHGKNRWGHNSCHSWNAWGW